MKISRNRIAEYVGEHKVRSAFMATALTLGIISAGNYVSIEHQDGRQSVPADSCESPFFTTQHDGDPQASNISHFLGNRTGVALHVSAGQTARGVRAAFKAPGDEAWTLTSDMLPVDALGNTVLTLAIGKGDVIFGVQAVAPEGDSICQHASSVDVEVRGVGEYQSEPGKSPWLNPGEAFVNLGIPVPPL